MNIDHEIDKLGLLIQKGEEILKYSYEYFSKEYSIIPDEIRVAISLYEKVIENIDGVFILLENASERCALSITRDLFENMLYLKFIMNDKYFKERALSYYYSYLKDNLSHIEMLLSNGDKGLRIRKYMKKERSDESYKELERRRESIKKIMKKKKFREIKSEWYRVRDGKMKEKNIKTYFPKWYETFEGSENIRKLAISCDFVAEYDMLYGAYSRQVHSTNAMEDLGINRLRTYHDPQEALFVTRSFGLVAIHYYIEFFLRELCEQFSNWVYENDFHKR
ncbi:hypothetical protein FHG65_18840 [Bacillus cereus]|uniref:Uncharacterized protein n=1 Tax=Bacillus cereus TaxID=1396 RepID=A0ABD7RGG6_BACCE|nr:DUF5677 domain-containing protein [Bacillus cereus]TNB96927.1 hypothetical protein FHG65_18840 [Bacillus cereus]